MISGNGAALAEPYETAPDMENGADARSEALQAVPMKEYEDAIDKDVKSKEKQEFVVQRINSELQKYRSSYARMEWEKNVRAVFLCYRGYKLAGGDNQFQYVIREGFFQFETLLAQICPQFFGESRLFRYAPQQAEFIQKAVGATEIVHAQMRRTHAESQLRDWLKCAMFYGVSYLTYGWQHYKRVVRRPLPLHSDPEQEPWKVRTEEIIFEAPYLEFIKPWEVYCHPFIEDCRNSPTVSIIKMLSVADLKTLARELYLDADAVQQAIEDGPAAPNQNRNLNFPSPMPQYDYQLDSSDGSAPHEMVVTYTNEGWEYVMLDGRAIARAQRCRYGEIPIIGLRNYPQAGEHYGIPELVSILDDQRLLNEVMSSYVYSIHMQLNPRVKVKRNAVKDYNAATHKPGGKIILDDMNDVMPFEVNPTTMSLEQVGSFLMNNMRRTTGLNERLAGSAPNTGTATLGVHLEQAATKRMMEKVALFAPAFGDAYMALYRLNAMYLDDKVPVRMLGASGADIFNRYGPDAFEPDVDVEVELANQSAGPEDAVKWQNAYQLTGQDPLVSRKGLLERYFRALGEKRPQALLSDPILAQSDALAENTGVLANGIIGDPKPDDNHQVHIQIHTQAMQTPEFMALVHERPPWAKAMQDHLLKHVQYFQAMQQAQQAQAQQSAAAMPNTSLAAQAQGPQSANPEANARTEAMFQNGARGAAQGGGTMR